MSLFWLNRPWFCPNHIRINMNFLRKYKCIFTILYKFRIQWPVLKESWQHFKATSSFERFVSFWIGLLCQGSICYGITNRLYMQRSSIRLEKTGRIKILDSTSVRTATILRRAPGEPYIRITESSRPGGTMSPLVNMSKRPLLEILEFSWQG